MDQDDVAASTRALKKSYHHHHHHQPGHPTNHNSSSSSSKAAATTTVKQKRLDHRTLRKSHPQCSIGAQHKHRYSYAFTSSSSSSRTQDPHHHHHHHDHHHRGYYVGDGEEEEEDANDDDYEYLDSYIEASLDQLQAELSGAAPTCLTPAERRERAKRRMARARRKLAKERGGLGGGKGKGKGTELLVFTFFLVVMMLTLSQVLVVHHKYNGRYGGPAERPHSARLKAREEMRMVDRSISALRRQHIPSPAQAAESLQKHVYTNRIADLIRRASKESRTLLFRRAMLQQKDRAAANASSSSSSSSSSSGTKASLSSSSSSKSNQIKSLSSSSSSSSSSSLSSLSSSSSAVVSSSARTTPSGNPENDVPVTSEIAMATDDAMVTTREEVVVRGGGGGVGGGGEGGSPKGPTEEEQRRREEEEEETSILSPYPPPCPEEPSALLGNVSGDVDHEHKTLTLSQVRARHGGDLAPGGEWSPPDCLARYRLAVIIPYRDRLAHLTVLLAHLLPILKRQQLHFRIFVVEQFGNLTFNKGRIMNAAFKEALKMYDFQCVVFHDVDLIPEDDRNMYSCPVMPRHMSVAINEMNYKLLYNLLVGGVLNLRVEHYQQVNGYSNMYWGWGGEDDDMAYRILHEKLKIIRPPVNIARYQMIKHTKRTPTSWNIRSRLLRTAVKRYHLDGLNSVHYNIKFIHSDPLYTHIMVDIGRPDMRV
ncbi:uncharacterized protein LOC143283381 isoform X1 [Babylonia areolata]|uniref:uncharacterized protein LOC143283381 isoform X1 n=1 Tax=Babylonia areolata TaxID=304850 RepID=UPI003FD3DCDB